MGKFEMKMLFPDFKILEYRRCHRSNNPLYPLSLQQLNSVESRLSAQNDVLESELASLGIESPDGVSGIGGLLRDAFDNLRSNLEQLTEEQAIANGKKEQLETELSHQTSLCEVSCFSILFIS